MRTREQVIFAIARELDKSERFAGISSDVWATHIYQVLFERPDPEFELFAKDFNKAVENSSVYGVEPRSMHKLYIHYEMQELLKTFFRQGHR